MATETTGTGPALMTCEEAATYLRLHERTVGRLLKQGRLPGVKVGRQWRLRRVDLDAYLAGGEKVGSTRDPESERGSTP